MPSAGRRKSYGSVLVHFLDEGMVRTALVAFVDRLRERPEVLAVVLFGSFASGRAALGSDVDLLIILSEDQRRFLDRIPDYVSDAFPVALEVFPYTLGEVQAGQPLAAEALRTGKILWLRPGMDVRGLGAEIL